MIPTKLTIKIFIIGTQKHIDLGNKYDLSICVYGQGIYIVLGRPGFNQGGKKHSTGYSGSKDSQRNGGDKMILTGL